MSRVDVHACVDPFLDLAIRGDGAAAVRLALGVLDAGASTESVVVDLLAASQRECGERWLRDEWTVADEHVVTGVVQRSLDAVANAAEPVPREGSVVVACAEGDWHSLPAQMCAEVLRAAGVAVSFLGASTPADHVARLLSRDRPDALLVTCNLALFFGGVTRLADAAHRAGTPVVAGGRALAGGPARALALGADGWASDVAGAVGLLRSWGQQPPTTHDEPVAVDHGARRLDLDSPQLAAAAFEVLGASYPRLAALGPDQRERTREDLEYIVRFAAAARLVGDPTVLTEFLDWLGVLLRVRGVPHAALVAGLEAVGALGGLDDDTNALIRHGVAHLAAPSEATARF